MREIKFRAWDPGSGYMTKGNTLKGVCNKAKDERFIWDDEVIIMQFTGLKDKNGVEIYEGDIVNTKSDHYGMELENINRVEWDTEGGSWFLYGFIGRSLGEFYEFEVIGNIYESPELLKEAK